jgi:hypothetical protein
VRFESSISAPTHQWVGDMERRRDARTAKGYFTGGASPFASARSHASDRA